MILFGYFVDNFVQHATSNSTNGTDFSNSSKGNNSIPNNDDLLNKISELCIYNATTGVVIFIFNFIIVSSFNMCAANQAHKIRCYFMSSILKQDIAWFDTNQTGDFASRMASDLTRIQDGIGEKAGICIKYLSTTVCCAVCGLYYGWKLALITFSITPLLTIAMTIISKVQAVASTEELEAYGAAGAVAEEVLSSIRTVVAFGGHEKEIQRYNKFLEPARNKGIKKGLLTSISSGLVWFGIFIGYAISFWFGVKFVVEDINEKNPEYTPGVLIIVYSNIMTATTFVGQTAPYFEAFNTAKGAAGKIFSVIKRKPYIDSSSPLGEKPDRVNGNIELKNIHFNYPARDDVKVLKGVSLVANAGETVALVGASGCGKSTIIQLILRFYDTIDGSVEVDENDVKDLNVGWLRNNIGFVGQEPVLFSTTIAQNIRYGKEDASMEEIEAAAKLANVHEFISGLPLKYETLVGDHGTQLSGGQKQRVAVARALIKSPKILLLDEATSALDAESEAIVQAALDKARKGRTTIVVAHRLSTIRNADKIIVLADGEIVETGSHESLMDAKGSYYQMVLTQMTETDGEFDAEDVMKPTTLQRFASVISSESHASDDSSHGYHPRHSVSSCVDDGDDEEIPLYWSRLFRVSISEWPYMFIGVICSVLMGIFLPAYGIIFGGILGVLSVDASKMLDDNLFYCLIFVFMAVASFAAAFFQSFLLSVASEKLTSKLRRMVFTKIITQDIAFFDHPDNSVGSLCAKLTSDAADMQGATGSRISAILQAASTFVFCVFLAVFYNYKIGAVVFAFAPVILLSVYFEGKAKKGQLLSMKTAEEKASKIAIESIESIRTVASLHQEEGFYDQYHSALVIPFRQFRKRAMIRGLTFAFGNGMQVFAYTAAFYYGSVLVTAGELTYPDMYKVIEGIIIGVAMLGQAVAFTPDYHKAKLAAGRIFKLLDLKADIDVLTDKGQNLKYVKGDVGFRKVFFNYPSRPKVKVLRDFDLEIESGKTIALVGSSGSGKSTCVQLVERFYDTLSGEVTVDDINVKDLNINNLRSHVGLVSQEPVLFSYSIAENIAYGKNSEAPDMTEIIEAARKANIHSFITSLPQGYETAVGQKGTQLSGGQKQRVAIARALLRDPKILILDEATSALDTESERVVQEALDNARSGRTCLVIAHRLTTIQNADSIAFIHKGRVAERGTHQELLKLKGHYYNLYNKRYSAM